MGYFNDPAWKVCGWVADTNYLYPARWGWINKNDLGFVIVNWEEEMEKHRRKIEKEEREDEEIKE